MPSCTDPLPPIVSEHPLLELKYTASIIHQETIANLRYNQRKWLGLGYTKYHQQNPSLLGSNDSPIQLSSVHCIPLSFHLILLG